MKKYCIGTIIKSWTIATIIGLFGIFCLFQTIALLPWMTTFTSGADFLFNVFLDIVFAAIVFGGVKLIKSDRCVNEYIMDFVNSVEEN